MAVVTHWVNCAAVENQDRSSTCRQRLESTAVFRLKGADAAKARVLVQAAARAQCAAHLGVVHIGESGAAEPEDDYFYRSRRNGGVQYSVVSRVALLA